jgi:NADH-quinone oxidoreductase subunit D
MARKKLQPQIYTDEIRMPESSGFRGIQDCKFVSICVHPWLRRTIEMSTTVETIEAMERPPVTMSSRLEGELLEVSMGPQHPSTHGVFRMNVALDGEIVRKLKPVFGYLHRNHEQIGEQTTYLGSMPYTDRLDYFCSMSNNWAYALSVEKLAGIEVPERAEYLRVILAELTRLQNHASLLGFLLSDMGAWGTPLMYAFREREKILDLFESLAGSRMMCDYMRFGGCRVDPDDNWLAGARKIADRFPKFLDEFEELILGNEIVIARTQNVGKLSADLAISAGITGPMLRACGVNYDIRKVDGYGFYPRFKFRIPLGEHGDTYDRLMMRALEMHESVEILKQALAQIQPGPIVNPKVKIRAFRPPVGEAYGRIEAPKGELGFYLVSDGGPNPYRYRVRPPSFINLTVLEDLCLGHTVADVMVILGSIDIVMGEVDR